jgi:ABC-type Fe3+ transport system substrate-binding protein
VTAVGEYAAFVLYQKKGADIAFVAPPDGLPATPLLVGAVNKVPHPETAKLFIDWAMSLRGQKFYQDNMNLIYASVRDDAPPMITGARLSEFKLLTPTDLNDYLASHDEFNKVWGAMLGL